MAAPKCEKCGGNMVPGERPKAGGVGRAMGIALIVGSLAWIAIASMRHAAAAPFALDPLPYPVLVPVVGGVIAIVGAVLALGEQVWRCTSCGFSFRVD